MADPLGRHRFREFLETCQDSTGPLDSYLDLKAYQAQSEELHNSALAMNDLYFAGETPINTLALPARMRDQLVDSFVNISQAKASLDRPRRHLLRSLYNNQFQAFIKVSLSFRPCALHLPILFTNILAGFSTSWLSRLRVRFRFPLSKEELRFRLLYYVVRLGKYNMSKEEREGLGDCFCLTNPRQPDHPIVVSSIFIQ